MNEIMTLKTLRFLVRSDIERFAEHTGVTLSFTKRLSIFLMPSVQAIFLYRLGRYFYLKRLNVVARLLYTLNIILWGTDITPQSDIGPYFYMPHTSGVTLFAVMGERCTCYAQAAAGGGSGVEKDIGAGIGLPVIGDGVLLGARSMIVGPVSIGSGSMIGANAFVTFDVPENSSVVGQSGQFL